MTSLDYRVPSNNNRPQFDILKDFSSKRTPEPPSRDQNPSSNYRKIGFSQETPPILEDPENQIQSSNSSFSKMKNVLIDDLKISDLVTRCLTHPDEEVQFFSFTQDKTLCAECLVSGAFQGHEIANIKKATLRIRRKFEDLFQDLNSRMEAITQLEKKYDEAKKEVSNIFTIFSNSVDNSFAEIRKKIDEKEKEIKAALNLCYRDKLSEIENSEESIKVRKEDTGKIGETLEKCISQLKSDEDLCHYFAKKVHTIKALINDEDLNKIQEAKHLLEVQCSKDHFNMTKFKEGVQAVIVEISTLKGVEEIVITKDSLDSAKGSILESPKGEPRSIFPTDFNTSSIHKSKDYSKIFQSSLSSSISGSPGKFLKNFESNPSTINDSKDLNIRIASNALIDKHLKKLFDIKSPGKGSPSPIEIIENHSPPKVHHSKPKPNIIDEIFNQANLAGHFRSPTSISGGKSSPSKKEVFKKSLGHISEFNLPKKGNTSSRKSLTESVFGEKGTPKSSGRIDLKISPTKRAIAISTTRNSALFKSNVSALKKDLRDSIGVSTTNLRISVKENIGNGSITKTKTYSPKDIDLLGLLRKQKDMFNKVTFQ